MCPPIFATIPESLVAAFKWRPRINLTDSQDGKVTTTRENRPVWRMTWIDADCGSVKPVVGIPAVADQ